MASRCRRVWAEGGVVHAVLLHLTDPRVAELAARVGWDAVWIDLEHSPKTTARLETMTRAVRAGAIGASTAAPDVLARPGKGEFMRMGRLLEAGAHGILYPRCESEAEAREAVRWMKFAPLGERGFDGGNSDNGYGGYPAADYVEQANRETWLAVQIETPLGVRHAEAIARVEHVDVVFFGPGDYSCMIGKPGRMTDPEVLRAAETVADAAHAAGRIFGTLGFEPPQARAMLDMGCRLLVSGADQGLLSRGMARTLSSARGLVG